MGTWDQIEREPGDMWGEQSMSWKRSDIEYSLDHMNQFTDDSINYQSESMERWPSRDLDEKNRRIQGARMVAAGYGDGNANLHDDVRDPYLPVDLWSPGKRLEFLDGFIQNWNPESDKDESTCGPTSMIAGAILADGPAGLKTLLDAVGGMETGGDKNELIEDLKKRIAAGEPISPMDIHDAQTYVYDTFKDKERADAQTRFAEQGEPTCDADRAKRQEELARTSVSSGTMQQLLDDNKGLRKMYQDSGMEISGIDLGGRNGTETDHFVLTVKGKDGAPVMVYDPWSKEKGQITARPHDMTYGDYQLYDSHLRDYQNATRVTVS